jgi:hypothetical protein
MSILRVNNIERATSGSNTVTFTDDVMFTGAVNISSGSITASFDIANASIQKEKLTNDARDWANILNRPAGIISSSGQFVSALSGSSLQLGGISATGSIRTTNVFSGSGAQLFGIPNTALNNSQITINGTSVALGGSRTLTTADVGESGNLYYTDARVKAKMNADGIVSQSNQINYQSITGQPTVNTLGGDGNQAFTITTGLFVTASGGADGIIVTNDAPNFTLRFRTVGGTVSSSAQIQEGLPANVVSSSTQVKPLLPDGTVSSSAQYPGWVTASSQIDYNSIQNKLSGVVSSSTQVQPLLPADTVSSSIQVKIFLPGDTVSSSAQYPGWITSSTQVVQSLPDGIVSSSAQYPGWVTESSQIIVQNTTGIGAIATTGSNTFIGNQTVSGSVILTGDLTVQGTSSILFVTSSQLNVGSNLITLNTTDVLRYGGLTVFDSGSLTNESGSLLWDSVNNVWIYIHAGTSNTSSIVITGPENTGALGDEQFLTPNLITKVGPVGDHIVNSQISDNGAQVGIIGSLKVTGSITSSHIVPAVTDTFDLGSPTLRFRDLYLSGSTLYLGTLAISDTGGALSVSPSGSPAGTNSPVSGAFTGSFKGNGNQLTNISNAALPGGIISSSAQLPAGTISSSAQYPGWVTSSAQIDYNNIQNKLSGTVSSSIQVKTLLPADTVSSSGQINAGATANFATAVAAQLGGVHSASFLGTATTNNLAEGVTNLYYTDARVKTKISADNVHSASFLGTATTDNLTQGSTNKYYANSLVLSYIDSLSVLSSSQQVVNRLPTGTVSSSTQIAAVQVNSASYAATASLALGVSGSLAVNTDGLPEGVTNLYYTDARVKTKLNVENVHSSSFLGTATTTNLTEGINLYFTNDRVKAALPGVVSSSTQVSILIPAGTVSSSAQIDYNNIQNKLSGVVSSSTQIKPLLPANTVTSSTQVTAFLPGGTVSSSAQYPGWVTASSQIDYNSIQNKLSGVVSSSAQVQPLLPAGTVSSSGQVNITTTTGYSTFSSSLATVDTAQTSRIDNLASLTSSYAVNSTIQSQLAGVVSSSTQVKPLLPGGTVSSSGQVDITATTGYATFSSSLATVDATQQVSLNALNAATSSYALQSQLAGVVSSSTQVKPLLPGGTVSSSIQVDYNSITNKLSGVYSSSAQTVASLAGQNITPSGSNFQGIVSGSGNQYRLVVPVGTNLYA